MKPFNLERALAGDPVVTRNGKRVTQLVLFDVEAKRPLFGVVDSGIFLWSKDGKYDIPNLDNNFDLFMAPKKRKAWILADNVSICVFNTREIAEEFQKRNHHVEYALTEVEVNV